MKTKYQSKRKWDYPFLRFITAALATSGIYSCSVVKTNYSSSQKNEATVYYYLPETIIKIRATAKVAVYYNADKTLNESSRLVEQSFVVTTETVSDTKNLLSLNYKPSALMHDDIKYGVNSKGLLETINITTEDRTADIISKLSDAPNVILGTSFGEKKAAGIIVKTKEFSADFAIKASDARTKKINWDILIVNELDPDQGPTTIPATFDVSSDNIPGDSTDLSNIVNGTEGNFEIDGILTRPLKNISLKINSGIQGNTFKEALPINIMIADKSNVIVIPVKRTAFVKRINKIGIQDGIILSNEINKPSSLEGFISIPVNIAKAIVSIPGQIVQFRFDNTKRLEELEKARLSYEKTIQDSQKFALNKEIELEKVKLEIEKSAQLNSVELQKTKLEIQTSLLEAEKKQLETKKALDDLRKSIEDLKKN